MGPRLNVFFVNKKIRIDAILSDAQEQGNLPGIFDRETAEFVQTLNYLDCVSFENF